MKKTMLAILMSISLLFLTGCKVNWFDKTYDAPWYFIAIPAVLVIAVAYIYIVKGTYICPECNSEIKLKWYQLSATVHVNGKRLVRCPKCNKKYFCERKKENIV